MRGSTFADTYGNNSVAFKQPGTPLTLKGVARLVLDGVGINYDSSIVGDPLTGYDIKAQECATLLRLSLLAQGLTSSDSLQFHEVYMKADGVATLVKVGEAPHDGGATNYGLGLLFFKTKTSDFVNKIDHILIKGRDPLPTRYNGEVINVMGKGTVNAFRTSCSLGYSTKDAALNMEAWAEFETSPQHEAMREKLQLAVKRSKWEQLVGYKIRFHDIPNYASMSQSQTTPKQSYISILGNISTEIPIIFNPDPEGGGIVDISGLSIIGSKILSVATGAQLMQEFGTHLKDSVGYSFTENDYFVLLDHQCGLLGLSRGENWFVLPTNGNGNEGRIYIRPSGAPRDVWAFLSPLSRDNLYYLRRTDGTLSSVQDIVKKDLAGGFAPFSGPESSAGMNRGDIIAGFGDGALECQGALLGYSIAKPSIQIRSPYGDAPSIASRIAAGGVTYTPIIIQDIPAPTGWNKGKAGTYPPPPDNVVYPPSSPDKEGEAYDVDSPIDELEGSVIDLSAPFLGAEGVGKFAVELDSLINGDVGTYYSYSFAGGGYGILPGMKFEGGIVHTIEFIYNDKDSISTNITTGPKYYSPGSYSDSQYVKRTETITRTGRVIYGSNSEGTFFVHIDGRGTFEAINGIAEPIFPGDRVEVKLMNVPVERN